MKKNGDKQGGAFCGEVGSAADLRGLRFLVVSALLPRVVLYKGHSQDGFRLVTTGKEDTSLRKNV